MNNFPDFESLHTFISARKNIFTLMLESEQEAAEIEIIKLYLAHVFTDTSIFRPFALCKQESPDFVMTFEDGGKWGIEITTISPIDRDNPKNGNIIKKLKNSHDDIVAYTENGYFGKSYEREWASELEKIIEKKEHSTEKYDDFNKNVLVIYSFFRPPALDITAGLAFFSREFLKRKSFFHTIVCIEDTQLITLFPRINRS